MLISLSIQIGCLFPADGKTPTGRCGTDYISAMDT
jgi:hypothetical protein